MDMGYSYTYTAFSATTSSSTSGGPPELMQKPLSELCDREYIDISLKTCKMDDAPVETLLGVWYILLIVGIVVLNIWVFVKLYRQRDEQKRIIRDRIDKLVLFLAAINISMALPLTFISTAFLYGRSNFHKKYFPTNTNTMYGHPTLTQPPSKSSAMSIWCDVTSIIADISCQASIYLIMIISVVRCITIFYPLGGATLLGKCYIWVVLGVSFVMICTINILPYVLLERSVFYTELGSCAKMPSEDYPQLFLLDTIPFFVPFIITLAALCLMACKVLNLMYKPSPSQNSITSHRGSTGSTQVSVSVMMMITKITIVFVICYGPRITDSFVALLELQYHVNMNYAQLVCSNCHWRSYYRHLVKIFLTSLNSLLNPLIYHGMRWSLEGVTQGAYKVISSRVAYLRRMTLGGATEEQISGKEEKENLTNV